MALKITKWNGKPISRPGIYSGVPLEKYHTGDICDGPSVSSTDLRKAWAISLQHCWDQWPGNPKSVRSPPTRPMILGSAAHHLLLGEDRFSSAYIGRPDTYRDLKTAEEKPWHAAANACKAWLAKQADKGLTVVTRDELEKIKGMARALQLEPLIQEGAMSGAVECSMFTRDQETGLWIKVRPDVIPTTGGDYVDLKVTAEIATIAIQSTIRTRGYHMQGGLIYEVCDQLGLPFETFILMFVEADRPHCVFPAPVADDDLARGRLQCRAMLRRIAGCIETGVWPGPFDGHLRPLGISNDERARIDARLTQEGLG